MKSVPIAEKLEMSNEEKMVFWTVVLSGLSIVFSLISLALEYV